MTVIISVGIESALILQIDVLGFLGLLVIGIPVELDLDLILADIIFQAYLTLIRLIRPLVIAERISVCIITFISLSMFVGEIQHPKPVLEDYTMVCLFRPRSTHITQVGPDSRYTSCRRPGNFRYSFLT